MVRVLTVSGWLLGASCAVLVPGCGGRASANQHAENDGGAAVSAAGTAGRGALAGSSSTSTGGAPSHAGTPGGGDGVAGNVPATGGALQAGGPGAGGVHEAGAPSQAGNASSGGVGGTAVVKGSPASVHDACAALCDEFNRCPDGEGNLRSSCREDCWSSVYLAGSPECTATGEDMLACLTATDRVAQPACVEALTFATQKCAREVAAYRACAVEHTGAALPPTFCAETIRSHAGKDSSCTEELTCLSGGVYSISCADIGEGQSSCSCQANDTTTSFTVGDAPPDACIYHLCIF